MTMDFSARHVDFVIICYAVSAVMLLGMTAMVVLRSRNADRLLVKLEAERAKHRAARTPTHKVAK